MKTLTSLLSLVCLSLVGCATPRVEAPRSATALGARADSERIPIRSFALESADRPFEIKSDMRFLSGDSRGVLFPKQAREYLAQDLRDYVASRFRIDPAADTLLTLKLEQAHTYFTMHSSGLNWVPFVGIATSIADGFQQVPITFVVEVKANVTAPAATSGEINAFIRHTEKITGWSGTMEKHRGIYLEQINRVRKELFERLDAQLLTQWRDGKLIPQGQANTADDAATLASELARLDTALADEKISKEEHAKLVEGVKAKYSPPTPAPAKPAPTA